MKLSCKKYSSEEISLFVDNELPMEKFNALEQHLTVCDECSNMVKSFHSMSDAFSHHVEDQVSLMDKNRKKESKNYFGLPGFLLPGRHLYLKLASLTVILVISMFSFQNVIFPATGPSAIVKSVDTDFASVMIIETQKNKHTIIWFNET